MTDVVVCAICGYEARNLCWHIRRAHGMDTKIYRKDHGAIVAPDVLSRKKATCLARYGVEHYTNRPAAALTNMTFEGGHSLRDPSVRLKAEETKRRLYGDPHYTNREKAKRTCMERYGVPYAGSVPGLIRKRVSTLVRKYGRVFNIDRPSNKIDVPMGFSADYLSGMPVDSLCTKYGVSDKTVRRWALECGLRRPKLVVDSRRQETPKEVVDNFFEACRAAGKVLSFYEYGMAYGSKKMTKIKRLFNAGGRFSSLRDSLFEAAARPELRDAFYGRLL